MPAFGNKVVSVRELGQRHTQRLHSSLQLKKPSAKKPQAGRYWHAAGNATGAGQPGPSCAALVSQGAIATAEQHPFLAIHLDRTLPLQTRHQVDMMSRLSGRCSTNEGHWLAVVMNLDQTGGGTTHKELLLKFNAGHDPNLYMSYIYPHCL